MPDQKEEQLNDKVINEEYKIWKKHSPFLYDVCLVKALQWPSLTLDWLTGVSRHIDREFITSGLLLSTAVSDYELTDYFYKALVDLPNGNTASSTQLHNFVDQRQKIAFDGPVLCAKASPSSNSWVAAMGRDGTVNVYDTADYPTSLPAEDGSPAKPTKQLKFHTKDGRSIAWHPKNQYHLASCAMDGKLALWDYNVDTPLAVHTSAIFYNEIRYADENMLGTIGEDGKISLFDLRDPNRHPFGVQAYSDSPGHSLDFNQSERHKLATGGADGMVKVWDLRSLKEPTNVLSGHSQQVRTVRWSPHESPILATGGDDRRIKIWDLSLVGQEQTAEEEAEGPPELIFIHGGHVSRINALEWCPQLPWTIASTSEDNIIQIWTPASAIVNRLD